MKRVNHRPVRIHVLASYFLLLLLVSCSAKSDPNIEKGKEPIVSVYGKTLYRSDIENAISERITAGDSLNSAEAYVKMWVNEELIHAKAIQNVADKDRIDKLVENYKQSLIVFTYLENLLKEELSKTISENDLKDYYDKNPGSLKLQSNIVKGLFLKVPKSSSELNNLRKWYRQSTLAAKESIEKSAVQNAVIYDYFYDRWISVNDVLSYIPVPISDSNQFLRTNKNFEIQDSTYVYLLHIEEYALAGNNTPYEYAKSQITDILINKKRDAFLKQFEQDLYKKALDENDIKFYSNQKEDTSR